MVFLWLSLACAGLGSDSGDGLGCDTMAVASVQVSVQGSAGEDLDDVEVTAEVDGDPVTCEEVPGEVWVCGWERAGLFTVTASAPGYEPADQSVQVEEGECHVVTRSLSFALEPAAG